MFYILNRQLAIRGDLGRLNSVSVAPANAGTTICFLRDPLSWGRTAKPVIGTLALAVFLVGMACTSAACANPVEPISRHHATAANQVCAVSGSMSISNGRYIVQNNEWNSNSLQCIDVTHDGFSIATASHHKSTGGSPAAYPSIYAGCHRGNCSVDSGLPMPVGDSTFANMTTSVSMSFPDAGQWDAAYDIWFDPTPRTDGQDTGAELMVWLDHRGLPRPVGHVVGTVQIAGGTWTVWEGNSGWNVVSYVRNAPTDSITFRVEDFYGDMVSRGYARKSWYLTSVQAGFETWVGQTGLAINSFDLED